MPIYNMAPWLGPALESCLAQTHADIDVVVVDDGSLDNGADIATAYALLDSRVRLVRQANAGAGAARSAGQRAAQGDYITWLDADDFLDGRAAEAWLSGAGRGEDMVCGNAVAFSSRTFNARRYFYHPAAAGMRFDTAPRYWKSKVLWRWIFSLPFVRAGGFTHPPYKLGQDVCFMYQALSRAGTFSQVSPYVYYFRQEHKSAHASLETRVEHGFAHFKEVRRILLEPPEGPPRFKPFVKYLNENYWRDIKKTAPLLSGGDAHWEKRIVELGLELFKGLDPAWFQEKALSPDLRPRPDFLPLAEAFIRGDAEAVTAIFQSLRAQAGPLAPDKASPLHSVRHGLKSLFNPLSHKAFLRLRTLESRAARRKGVPRPEKGRAVVGGR
jgi:glycosyltransferase involved in cell wall biosynthesis